MTKGGLWYEEALPTETTLSGLVMSQESADGSLSAEDVLNEISNLVSEMAQLGGNATVGRGLCQLVIS